MLSKRRRADRKTWWNWGRTAASRPSERRQATDVEQVAAIIADASRRGLRVKAVGSGHSFTDIACTDDIQLDVGGIDRFEAVDQR